jgi:hypothetical protein
MAGQLLHRDPSNTVLPGTGENIDTLCLENLHTILLFRLPYHFAAILQETQTWALEGFSPSSLA